MIASLICLLRGLSNAHCSNYRVFVADRNHNRVRVFDASTGQEISGEWSSVFCSASCDKPSVWSVRIDAVLRRAFVANSNFGAGSSCPSVAAGAHSGRVAIVPLPGNGSIAEPNLADVGFVDLVHGFPHEICVDSEDGVRTHQNHRVLGFQVPASTFFFPCVTFNSCALAACSLMYLMYRPYMPQQ